MGGPEGKKGTEKEPGPLGLPDGRLCLQSTSLTSRFVVPMLEWSRNVLESPGLGPCALYGVICENPEVMGQWHFAASQGTWACL